ncbi:MAG TPA: hypothetical protein VLF67_00260, partial [Candidatus Saccharimonas sp.]|nr:hypothetical protein [Candidatus Saccharimonas sp.]
MKCSACSQELPAEAFGPLVCPQCGTVNVSFGAEHVPPARAAGRAPLPRHQRLALIQAAAAVALLLVGGAVAAYSLQAPHRPAPVAVATATPTATPAATPTATPTPSPTLTLAPTPAKATPTVPPTLDAQMASINQTLSRYHLTITLSPANNAGTYSTWSTLTKDDVYTLKTFAPYLTEEWSKYPTDLVHNSGLKTIGLVKDLKVSTQARAAAPAPSIDGML